CIGFVRRPLRASRSDALGPLRRTKNRVGRRGPTRSLLRRNFAPLPSGSCLLLRCAGGGGGGGRSGGVMLLLLDGMLGGRLCGLGAGRGGGPGGVGARGREKRCTEGDPKGQAEGCEQRFCHGSYPVMLGLSGPWSSFNRCRSASLRAASELSQGP